jgi:hypothetical protein
MVCCAEPRSMNDPNGNSFFAVHKASVHVSPDLYYIRTNILLTIRFGHGLGTFQLEYNFDHKIYNLTKIKQSILHQR